MMTTFREVQGLTKMSQLVRGALSATLFHITPVCLPKQRNGYECIHSVPDVTYNKMLQ